MKKEKDEKRKRRRKKRKKIKKIKSKGETTEEEEEEKELEKEVDKRKEKKSESPKRRIQSLRESTALVLFRNFAKTVYAPRHSQLKLFLNLEDLMDFPSSTAQPTHPNR